MSFVRKPLGILAASGLLVTASARTAYALVTAVSLVGVFLISTLIYNAAKRLLPVTNRAFLAVFVTTFVSSLLMLILFLTDPFLALCLSLVYVLIPVLALDTEICTRFLKLDLKTALLRAGSEALFWGLLIVAASLIRESLGNFSLSLPGGARGFVEFAFVEGSARDYAVRFALSAGGTLVLIGFFIALTRKLLPKGIKKREKLQNDDEKNGEETEEAHA